ncbi:MAG: nicotinate (nicotinamide) nucleotide adenylyltransferase [Natronospirillum sp.]|uniref:nicotinate (nicotinamide) nucleotide adenylyltransferase n=1 Tax=Natronospirillum sp. TaxID=2812955 RepID=UPI0025ED32EE|nr:nicotinate (nicotinamide) nucleotide adenylyltransferase [Natronospirillum sp.]MCH8551065.1 nicotinate (nicotinamide) nucleotide adenylyltransferase [Natronospirillum sp.]
MDILYGGTFDPPHKGHERFVELMMARLPDARVHLLPCWQPVHKDKATASPEARLGMLRALLQPWHGVRIDQREIHARAPCYTLDTLIAWRQELGPKKSLVFALGSDSLAGLPTWSRWQQLTDVAHILVLPRPGCEEALPAAVRQHFTGRWLSSRDGGTLAQEACGRAMELSGRALACASSDIRDGHASLADTVPGRVLDYIKQERLYPSLEVE